MRSYSFASVSRLRVLAVANWDWAARPTPWATQRVESLRQAGAEVEVLAVECVADRLGFLRLWRALDARLRRDDFDVVAPLYGSLLGLMCAVQRRVPCALSFAGTDLNGLRDTGGRLVGRGLLSIAASQLSAALAAGVSVPSAQMKHALWWPSARRAAPLTPDGIDVCRFRPRDRAAARLKRGLPVAGQRVAFVALGGTVRTGKRMGLAEAAVARLPGVALDVIAKVPFAEMPLVYAAADALVVTSAAEGSPNCVKEALACAIPVISVDVGDVRQLLEGLTNCAVVPPEPDALAAALASALHDGRGCPEGPQRMAEAHALPSTAARFIRFYESVAASCGSSATRASHSTETSACS
jgi:hypothetical protein